MLHYVIYQDVTVLLVSSCQLLHVAVDRVCSLKGNSAIAQLFLILQFLSYPANMLQLNL